MSKGDIAYENFLSGLTCTQSVLCAFSEETGMDMFTAMKISLPFGGGMGRMRLTCGAVTGMMMVYGLLFSPPSVPTREEKGECYKDVRLLSERFKERAGSVICSELLGIKNHETETHMPEARTAEYYKKRPCPEICRIAADVLEEFIRERKPSVLALDI